MDQNGNTSTCRSVSRRTSMPATHRQGSRSGRGWRPTTGEIVAVMADAFDDPWEYEEAREEFQRSRTHNPSLWLVAFDGDRAVGALFSYITDGRGQVSALGVRERWRRRGIGQALLRGAFVLLRERGVAEVRLNVDRDNVSDASRLYERAGMRLRRRWLVVSKIVFPRTE
jgi:mycothiol synthase